MKEYPSIPRGHAHIVKGVPVYGFDKLDGTMIRAEWERKKGFWKFGTKTCLLDDRGDAPWAEAPGIVRSKYERDLHDIFRKERWQKAVAFFEFWGRSSFAGRHEAGEPHDVTFLDVSPDKRGILLPQDFLKAFGKLDIPRLLHHGNATEPLLVQIEEGELEGMTFEGVVFKGAYVNPGRPMMFKWKNRAWLDKLRKYCQGDEKMFAQMA